MAARKQTDEFSEEVTFGRLLNMLRTQQGIDLKTISNETRIAVGTLRLLEEEAYDKLPDPVFVKGFLKSYAEVVGARTDTIIQSYLSGRHHYHEALRFEANQKKSGESFWPRLVFSLGLLACIVLISIKVLTTHTAEEAVNANPPTSQKTPVTDIDTQPRTNELQPAEKAAPETSYLLQVDAVEETWLKVIVDRQDPKQYLLNPGDSLEIKATSGFNLLIGNATGIHLQLNHRSIAIEGTHGQVVALKLPK